MAESNTDDSNCNHVGELAEQIAQKIGQAKNNVETTNSDSYSNLQEHLSASLPTDLVSSKSESKAGMAKNKINNLMESPLPASYNRATQGQPIDCSNQSNYQAAPKPLVIGVTGGTASGKTSLCNRIAKAFKQKIALISLDMFYKGLS